MSFCYKCQFSVSFFSFFHFFFSTSFHLQEIAFANISRGFIANFRQDSVSLIRRIPLLPSQVSFLLIRRTRDQNTSQSFKVSCKRVEILDKFSVYNLDAQDMDHGFVSDYSISKPYKEQIANFLWP